VITNIFLGLFVYIFKADQFYFFKNLGYNKVRLFAFTFSFDMLIWFTMSWLTLRIFI
jgi:hypothetical protein